MQRNLHLASLLALIMANRDRAEAQDMHVPHDIAAEMHAAIPESALWVVPMHGHPVLCPEWGGSAEARSVFPSVLRSFFTKVEEGS